MSLAEQYDDLTDELAGPEPDWDSPPDAPDDAEEINARLRRLAAVRGELANIEETGRAEIDRINEWMDRRSAIARNKEQWLLDGLEMYHRAILAQDPARKSISLPCGTLKARKQQPEWTYDDVSAFVEWAKGEQPQLLRYPPTPDPVPDKSVVKKALMVPALDEGETAPAITEGGEVVPGVSVTLRGPAFSIELDEDE